MKLKLKLAPSTTSTLVDGSEYKQSFKQALTYALSNIVSQVHTNKTSKGNCSCTENQLHANYAVRPTPAAQVCGWPVL